MGLLHPLDLSDWAKNLTMWIFYRACQNPGRKNSHFQLLTHHYIARRTLKFHCDQADLVNKVEACAPGGENHPIRSLSASRGCVANNEKYRFRLFTF